MTPSPFHGIFSAFGNDQNASPHPASFSPTFEINADEQEAPPQKAAPASKQAGQIAVDIYEQNNYYIVRAPIAGIRLQDLDIEVDGRVITIRGIRHRTEEIPDDQYYLQECFWGEFSRSITLPCSVDPKKVKATYSKDSILKILIPKEERVKIVRVNEGG